MSALHHITHAMMRLMAPILSFTANEIWQTLGLDKDATVFEEIWYALPAHGLTQDRIQAWEAIIEVRGLAAKEIEVLRAAGHVAHHFKQSWNCMYRALSLMHSRAWMRIYVLP